MKTVHMIGNAHLDPVWLWRKADGINTVLATARSACDRLDEYPDFVFTCSTNWFYEQTETHDPGLFERIRHHVGTGRWQLVGGMVVQPDCNLPSAEAFDRQLQHGQRYYREKFGVTTTIGYNVDSFGHTAYLPAFLRRGGIDSYVFMRPAGHEKDLPAHLFRWRSPDGDEVTTFRIAGPYCTRQTEIREHIEKSISNLPEGIDHTMSFFGVGDHGGGPTREQIEWILEHREAIDGVRLVFSHPRDFFDAVAPDVEKLPVVTDELQHHAIGCYSVERRIKVSMRRAEAKLLQAEETMDVISNHGVSDAGERIDKAWKKVLFNQFHDILGGTCLMGASADAVTEISSASVEADELITLATRRTMREVAEPGVDKIVAFNPASRPFDGLITHEICFRAIGEDAEVSLFDEDGDDVPFQIVDSHALLEGGVWILMRLTIPARGTRILRITQGSPSNTEAEPGGQILDEPPFGGVIQSDRLSNQHLEARVGKGTIEIAGWTICMDVMEDQTDTWSHSSGNRFDGPKLGDVTWPGTGDVLESGPLRASLRLGGTFDHSRTWCRLMLSENEPFFRLRLAVDWIQPRQRLRMRFIAPGKLSKRVDLVSGGPLERAVDGLEYPLGGGLRAQGAFGSLAVVAPDVFSVAVDPDSVNLTLLRSPYAAHHDVVPEEKMRPDQPLTDQGTHEFDLCIWPGGDVAAIKERAEEMSMPPISWNLTG